MTVGPGSGGRGMGMAWRRRLSAAVGNEDRHGDREVVVDGGRPAGGGRI